jgi:hypothetical protein
MGLALAVFGWQVIGAAITFKRVGGARGSPLAPLISLAFAAILAGGWTGPFNVWRAAVAVTGLVGALVLFEWARRTHLRSSARPAPMPPKLGVLIAEWR